MKLHGSPFSTCTRKVLMTFHEKGHEPQFVPVDLGKGEQKSPSFTAMQPFGKVPVLDDDGFLLYESRAIIRYLDGRLPGAALTPADAKDRARMEQWLSVEASYMSPAAMAIVYQLLMAPRRGLQPDMAVVEKGRKDLAHALDVLERALDGRQYLAGDALSLADITYMPYLQYVDDVKHGDLVAERSHVAAWWGRLRARPAWQKTLSLAAHPPR